MKILIIGGYGTLGGSLARLLSDDRRINLLIAGRSLSKAYAFCGRLIGNAGRAALFFDRQGDVGQQILDIAPDLVVDAAGPYQLYGNDPYKIVKVCLEHSIHYLDVADGADFVAGIAQFDQLAQERDLFILSGVGTFSVLYSAVMRELGNGLSRVNGMTAGVTLSPRSGMGVNAIRAIFSYAGKKLILRRAGELTTARALNESIRYTISPPGHLPLRNLRFSLMEVPDLQLLPPLWPDLHSLWIGGGTQPEILLRLFNMLAWILRWRLLRSLLPLAKLMHTVSRLVRWGEHRGGMFVTINGIKGGRYEKQNKIERSWHLIAEGNDGILLPAMAAERIIFRCLDGKSPLPGARAAITELELADFEDSFRKCRIYTGRREVVENNAFVPLYQRILGTAWDRLPPALCAMHASTKSLRSSGQASVERGKSILARMVAYFFGVPNATKKISVDVLFTPYGDKERWQRTFGKHTFFSIHSEGRGRFDKLIEERFGLFSFGLAIVLDEEKLKLVLRNWQLFGIPLPLRWAPSGETYEFIEEGKVHFKVEISHRLTGLIVRYRGWLVPHPHGNG